MGSTLKSELAQGINALGRNSKKSVLLLVRTEHGVVMEQGHVSKICEQKILGRFDFFPSCSHQKLRDAVAIEEFALAPPAGRRESGKSPIRASIRLLRIPNRIQRAFHRILVGYSMVKNRDARVRERAVFALTVARARRAPNRIGRAIRRTGGRSMRHAAYSLCATSGSQSGPRRCASNP